MKKLPRPFYTARVAEALSSLTNYVAEANRIANEIKPVMSANAPLTPDPDVFPKGPKLARVDWIKDKAEIVEGLSSNDLVEIRTTHARDLIVAVRGEQLASVSSFALIPAANLGDVSWTTDHVYLVNSILVAAIKGKAALPPGSYHAWVQDGYGQEDVLFDAVEVVEIAEMKKAPVPSKKQ